MYHPSHHAHTDRLSPPAGLSPCAGGAEQKLLRGPSGGAGGCGSRAHGGLAKEPPLPRSSAIVGSGLVPPAPATVAALSLDDSDLASVVSESWNKCAASRRFASVAPSAPLAQAVPQTAANASATAPASLPGSFSSGSRCGRFAAWGCADPLFAIERGALLVGDSGISHASETPFRPHFPRAHPSAHASAGHGVARGSSASSISTSYQRSALYQRPFSPSATPGHVADCLERTADSVGARQGQGGTAEGRVDGVGAGGGSSGCGRRRSGWASSRAVLVGDGSAHPANHLPPSAAHALASAAAGWEEAMGEANGEGMGEAMGCWAEGMGEAERAEDMEEGFELSEYLSLPDDLAWCAWPACDQVAVSRGADSCPALGDVAHRAGESSEPQPNSFCRAHQALTSDARVRGGCLMSLLARMDGDGMQAHQTPASALFSAPRTAHSPAPFVSPIATVESSPHQRHQQLSPAVRADAACGNEAAALLERADAVAAPGAGAAPVAAETGVGAGGARGGLQAAMDGASGEGTAAEGLLWAALPDAWFRGLDVWEDAPGGADGHEGPAADEGQAAHARWDGGPRARERQGRGTGAKGQARGGELMAGREWSDVGAAGAGGSGGLSESHEEHMQWQVETHEGAQGTHAACMRGQGAAAAPRASARAVAAEAWAGDGEGERLPAMPAAALPAAPCPSASPLAASPPSASAVPLSASPAAAGGAVGAERRERRQRSTKAPAAAAAAGGASAGGEAGEARQVAGGATVGRRAGGGAEGSGAMAGGTRCDPGAAGVGGGPGAATFVPYHVWHQPAAPLMPPMLFVQPPFPPAHLPYPQAGSSVPVAMRTLTGAGGPTLFPARPAALATPPPAPATTTPAAAAPSASPAALAPPRASPARAPPALGLDPLHMHHPLFAPPPALYPAAASLHGTCAARCAATMMMAAATATATATATAMATRRHLLGVAGQPLMKRKRGRQKKPPPRNGPCGATTNLRRIVPRAEGEQGRDEGGAGADGGEARGGGAGSRDKGVGGSGSGAGSSSVAGGAARGAGQGHAASDGGGGGGRIKASKVGRMLSATFGGGSCAPVVGPVFMPRAYVPFPLAFHTVPQGMHGAAIAAPFTHLAVPSATAVVSGAASDGAAAAVAAAGTNAASPCAAAAAAAAATHTVSSAASPPTPATAHDSLSSGTAFAAAGSSGTDVVERMPAAPVPPIPTCAPRPALSSLEPLSSSTQPAEQLLSVVPATDIAAASSADGGEGRVHGARLVSRILEMGRADAKECTGTSMHCWKLAKVEQ